MDGKFFWFPLHGGDFTAKTSLLSCEEIGCYIQLMIHLIRHDRCPKEIKLLKRR